MVPRFAWLFLIASCVDLSRPSVLTVERDGPVFDLRDGTGGGGGDGRLDVGGADVPVVLDGPEEDGPLPDPDMGEPVDTTGLDLLIINPPDLAPPDLPLVTNGRPCAQNMQCASGVCSNGVCCDRACDRPCFSCTLTVSLGICTTVPAGEDPGNHCAQGAASSCGQDGTCDGQGGCRRYPANTQCAAGRCENATEFAASTCDGAGSCRMGASKSCAPGICMGATCASGCTQQNQCQAGFYCDGSKCSLKKMNGVACGMAFECASNTCVDGVCCDNACGQMCQACNVAGSVGTCTMVPSGMDPRNQCPAEAATSCGRAGGCNGAGACRLHPMGTTCAPSACANLFSETTARTCNGLGVCQPAGSRTCAPYFCSGSASSGACPTSCTTSSQCQPGFQCTGNACVRIPGLALYWRFEESMGTTAFDSSGNDFHGTYIGLTGAPAPSMMLPPPVMYPNAFSRAFVRSDRQAVRLAPIPAALRPANNLTLSVWYRTTSVDTMAGAPRGGELISGGDYYLLRVRIPEETAPMSRVETSRRTSGSPQQIFFFGPVLDGNWHHVAVVLASDGMRLYLDGQERASSPGGSNIVYTGRGTDLFVGRHGFNEEHWDFEGNIDEVRIYTRALGAPEIMALAQGQNAP